MNKKYGEAQPTARRTGAASKIDVRIDRTTQAEPHSQTFNPTEPPSQAIGGKSSDLTGYLLSFEVQHANK